MFIADFHIHSKYSRATSRDCVPESLDMWARRKGLDLIGTGDFTHPAWRQELREKLIPAGDGLYQLKDECRRDAQVAGDDCRPRFIVSGEISSIYKKNGKVRKVHNVVLLPGLEEAEAISRRLEAIGNLHSDGRPILGLDSRDLLEIVLDNCPDALFIPAHIWTPHFSLHGAYSGFDTIEECFEDLTSHIYALETGLSSDPPMNWRLSALDRFAMLSNSDAHSPANLAREANLFNTALAYPALLAALKNPAANGFYGTLEFFPEEGKYHCDGHRACKLCLTPDQTRAAGGVCPACGGRITLGVLHRVEALADRAEGFIPPAAKPFESLVPLPEVIAASLGLTVASVKVKGKYESLLQQLGPELFILRQAPLAAIEQAAGACIAEGVRRLRCRQVDIRPGYDGEYGKISILDQDDINRLNGQLCFFSECKDAAAGVAANELKQAATAAAAALPQAVSPQEPMASQLPYGLNPQQWQAVCATDAAVAVAAGPGTGKTRTLVCRIAYLVEQCGVPPARITAVTFTNKAAAEMQNRLARHFGDKRTVKAMTIGTFHSICLRQLAKQQDRRSVAIIDSGSAASIMEELIKDSGLKLSVRDTLKAISLQKNGAEAADPAALPPLYDDYCARLAQYGVMDYDDILLNVLRQAEADGAAEPDSCFSHLLVDEFQDINAVQYRLIKAWSKNSDSLFIIGDPDQSIYGFRGSDCRYFDRFAVELSAQQIRLTQNYRSTPEILACANAVIAGDGQPRCLEPNRQSGANVRRIAVNDDFAEALYVAKEINRLVGGIDMLAAHQIKTSARKKAVHTRGFADIAVLYRTNRQAAVLEQCLQTEGIPYTVAGRGDFLSDPTVWQTVAFFRLLLNPGDLLSLRICLQAAGYPPRLAKLFLDDSAVAKSTDELAGMLAALPNPPALDPANCLSARLRHYEPLVRVEKPARLLASWIDDNGLGGVQAMELLLNTSLVHVKMADFLENLAIGGESDILRSGGRQYTPDAVALMTMHAAKGLEFPVVFLCGVNDGTIPLTNGGYEADLAEERRLFYVGLTRAQDELSLLTARTPSPFLAAMPPALISYEQPARRPARVRQDSLFE
ncbi:MAG: UvrD-helicase domain-containing protein [Sporomusaceae bacterium]|nr:UvrD-helicase domain-containing protein [Sporomusaceae bacterium]